MTAYSKEFKEKALKLSDDIDVKEAYRQLGLWKARASNCQVRNRQ